MPFGDIAKYNQRALRLQGNISQRDHGIAPFGRKLHLSISPNIQFRRENIDLNRASAYLSVTVQCNGLRQQLELF